MKRNPAVVLVGFLALCGAPPGATAQETPAITSALAYPSLMSRVGISKAIDPSRDILPRAIDQQRIDPPQAGVTQFDERVESYAEDPGGPTILLRPGEGGFDPSRPADGVIGPFWGSSDVRQRTNVAATPDSVTVRSSASLHCRRTRYPNNALMGAFSTGSANVVVSVFVARACRYEIAATISVDADDRFFGRGSASANVTSPNSDDIPGGNAFEEARYDGSGLATGTLRLTGVVQPGWISLTLSAELEQSGPAATASWSATLTLAAEEPTNEIRWTNRAGGRFDVASNWVPPTVPGSSGPGNRDTAVFDRPGRYTVDFSAGKRALPVKRHLQHVQSGNEITFPRAEYILDSPSAALPSFRLDGSAVLVLDGTILRSQYATLGSGARLAGACEVRVQGPESAWFCERDLIVGGADGLNLDQPAQVTVTGGGELRTAETGETILGAAQQKGRISIDGEGSSWTAGDVTVGSVYRGSIVVQDGAQATLGDVTMDSGLPEQSPFGAGEFISSFEVEGVGAAGTRSQCTAGDVTLLGGESVLRIGSGGEFRAQILRIGVGASGGASAVNVFGVDATGASAPIPATLVCDDILVGDDGGAGSLVVAEGGQVIVQSEVDVNGDLLLTDPPAGPTASVTLSVDLLKLGLERAGRVSVENGAVLECGAAVVGEGLPRASGRVELRTSDVVAGVSRWYVREDLRVGANGVEGFVGLGSLTEIHVGGSLTVSPSGRLAGEGYVQVGGAFVLDGIVAPTLQLAAAPAKGAPSAKPAPPLGGTLTIDGDLVVGPTGVIATEAAGPTASRVVVNGDVTLGGTLVLQFRNGYAPKAGEPFEVLQASGAVSGEFDAVDVRGLAPGAQFDLARSGASWTATAAADTVALPTVSIRASPRKLLEKKAKKKGLLTFKRTGDASAPLTVSYAIGGTAVNGEDCVQLLGSVTFPPRKRSVKVRVEVANDRFSEGTETLEVTVLSGADATASLASTARFAIVDDEAPAAR